MQHTVLETQIETAYGRLKNDMNARLQAIAGDIVAINERLNALSPSVFYTTERHTICDALRGVRPSLSK